MIGKTSSAGVSGAECRPSEPGSKRRYDNVSCSQCGASFGPGDHGFSHCFSHQRPEVWIPELIRNEYDKCPDLGAAGFKAFDDSWIDGADEIASKIVERLVTCPYCLGKGHIPGDPEGAHIEDCTHCFATGRRLSAAERKTIMSFCRKMSTTATPQVPTPASGLSSDEAQHTPASVGEEDGETNGR